MGEEIRKLIRYGAVSLLSYIALFVGMLLAVEVFRLNPAIAYVIVLTTVYIGVYFASARYVFKKRDNGAQRKRFGFAVLLFWTMNTVSYALMVKYLGVQYLVSVLLNVIVFGTTRYLFYRSWVFRETMDQQSSFKIWW